MMQSVPFSFHPSQQYSSSQPPFPFPYYQPPILSFLLIFILNSIASQFSAAKIKNVLQFPSFHSI
jgi:hypothetical protein